MAKAHYPPLVPGHPLWGSLFDYRRDPLGFATRVARDFPDIATVSWGPYRGIHVGHPDHIKDMLVTSSWKFHQGPSHAALGFALGQGLLTSENLLHLYQRRLMQPAFHRLRIAAYAQIMAGYAAEMAAKWHSGQQLDIAEAMMQLTLRIVGKTLFDTDIRTATDEIGAATTVINHYASLRSVQLLGQLWHRFPSPASLRFREVQHRLNTIIYRLLHERRLSGKDHGDLFSALLLSRDEKGVSMPDQQIRDEAVTLFLAGHETTANALTWCWYTLSQHPEIEARFHEELDRVLGGRAPTVEDIPHLVYTEKIFKETLRLYPPAYGTSKTLIEEHDIGPYHIPKNTVFSTFSYIVHRDPRWWPDPLVFDPERWTSEADETRPRFAYFPFGGGQRDWG
ncbi:MAG: cytochrome P450, partial [Chloroflexi bacterium]|nr:cytochrome P450 [Chloroflexota bacterium]